MRRAAIPCILLLVVLSGLLLILDIEEPRGVVPCDGRSPVGLREAAGAPSAEPATRPDGWAPPSSGVGGMLWQDGGAPVARLVCRLETSDRRPVRRVVSAPDGTYDLTAADLARAGAGARLSVNPPPGDDRYRAFDFRIPAGRARLDVYVPGGRRPAKFDLEVEVLGIRDAENGGGPVEVWLQNPRGVTGRWALDSSLTRVTIPGIAEDVYAVGASQGDLVAYAPPASIGPARSPLHLVLEKGAWLTGRVVGMDGRPAAGARLLLVFDTARRRRLRGQYVYDVATSGHHHHRRLATTDAEGRFRIAGLFPARHTLGVAHESGTARVEVRIPSAGNEVALPVIVLEPRTGRVVVDIELGQDTRPARGDLRLLVIGYTHGARREVPLEAGRSQAEFENLPPDDYAVLAVGVEVDRKTRARFESIVSEYGLVRVEPEGRHAVTLGPSP